MGRPAILLLGLGLVATAIALLVVGVQIRRAVDLARRESTLRALVATFGPAVADAHADPLRLLVWYPVARTSRLLFPDAFQALDRAAGGTFPFTKDQVQAAHARWTAEWLAWERSHDAEYSVKTAQVEDEIARAGVAPLAVAAHAAGGRRARKARALSAAL